MGKKLLRSDPVKFYRAVWGLLGFFVSMAYFVFEVRKFPLTHGTMWIFVLFIGFPFGLIIDRTFRYVAIDKDRLLMRKGFFKTIIPIWLLSAFLIYPREKVSTNYQHWSLDFLTSYWYCLP